MDFYRIHQSSFYMLDQHNPPNSAIPALSAATKEPAFQADRLGGNRGDHSLAQDKPSISFECPPHAEISPSSNFNPYTCPDKSDILGLNDPRNSVGDRTVGTDAPAASFPTRHVVLT